ncbi:MAG TPA: OmpA family protein [Polyangia bacterium]
MRPRRRLLGETDPTTSEIWPAFTDVMSTMAMILFVLLLLGYVRSLISAKRVDAFQRQIAASEAHLHSLEGQLLRTTADVAAAQAKLHDQEGVISDSKLELDTVRAQLQGIAVLRVSVLNKLKEAIESELNWQRRGGGALVTVGDNGNLVINESLVFEYGSYAIKKDARPVLDSLARALGKLLADAAVRDNIDTVLIQGHTDERGSSSYNWDLSAKRATAVLDYLFESNPTLSDAYGSYFAASAYSKFRPLDTSKTEAAYRQNRRIEISIVPKDANIRRVIDDYMSRTQPTAPAAPSPTSP